MAAVPTWSRVYSLAGNYAVGADGSGPGYGYHDLGGGGVATVAAGTKAEAITAVAVGTAVTRCKS